MDTFEAYVWEPSLVKSNALTAATEACCLVLSVDETVCAALFASDSVLIRSACSRWSKVCDFCKRLICEEVAAVVKTVQVLRCSV